MGKDIDLDEFSNFLKNKAARVNENIEKAIKLCGEKVVSDIKYSMDHTQRDTSKVYYTNNKTKGHNPSLPGNPPAPDTGNLKGTIRYEVHDNKNEVYGVVGTTQRDPDYGLYLEYGTSKMAARPWLKPAMRKNNDFIKKTISNAVKNTLTGVGK